MEPQRRKRQVKNTVPFFISLFVHICCLVAMSVLYSTQHCIIKPYKIQLSINEYSQDFVELQPLIVEFNEGSIKFDSRDYTYNPDLQVLQVEYEDIDTTSVSNTNLVSLVNINTKIQIEQTSSQSDKNSGSDSGSKPGFGDGIKNGIKNRLLENGAGTGDVQVSIAWDNYNDIDVWVIMRDGNNSGTISWINRICGGGFLDIDKNVNPETNKAIENIFWPIGSAPYCEYSVYIQHYHTWDKTVPTKVLVRILVDGEETYKMVTIKPIDGLRKIHTFKRRRTNQHQSTPDFNSGPKPAEHRNNSQPVDNYVDLIQPAPIFR